MIKLLSSLKKLPAENCVILTYNLDLSFFEAALFESLYGAGCRNTLILCDPEQYHSALQDASLLRYAGQRYLLFSGRTSPQGAFHPKLVLLTTKTAGRLFITSGNLSRAGYTHNWEVSTDFEFNSRRPDPVAWQAFRWAFDLVGKIAEKVDYSKLVQERLARLWGTTPWLREDFPLEENAPVWFLHNLDSALIEQIVDRYHKIDGSPVKDVCIVSPFFDPRALAFAALLDRLHPANVQVYTQSAQGLRKESIDRVLLHRPAQVTFHRLIDIPRRLHAKALLFKTERGVWLASGSANFSAPALLHAAEKGNTEMVVLRHETEPTYFDEWMAELTQTAIPLAWDALPTVPDVPTQPHISSEITLLAVNLRNTVLELNVIPEPNPECLLRVIIDEDPSEAINYSHWKKDSNGWLSLQSTNDFVKRAERPMLISIQIVQPSGETLLSRPVLLHNLASLEKFSKPPRQLDRRPVPEGLVTENEEQCAQLLEMIHGLLITNQEQLARHNPRIVAQRKREQEEVEISGDYNPDEHIVPEPVRRSSGGFLDRDELYIDYDERLTYQEILNAVLSVGYHSQATGANGQASDTNDLSLDNPNEQSNLPSKPVAITSEEALARARTRISSGFKRLIENFLQGISDPEYMETVSPAYLLELWVIVATYLRVVWHSNMLPDELFQEHFLTLLYAFWGKPSQPGAWKIMDSRMSEAEKQAELRRLMIPLNLWINVAVLSESLKRSQNRSRYDLAGWIRMWANNDVSPLTLSEVPENAYRYVWQTSFHQSVNYVSASDLVRDLMQFSLEYDDASLKDEIKTLSGFTPTFNFGNIAGTSQVPCLFLNIPLSDRVLDRCWKVFQLFITQPRQKSIAWARFENTNPAIDVNDIRKITIFYRSDNSLLFAVERTNGDRRPDIEKNGIFLETLERIEGINELEK